MISTKQGRQLHTQQVHFLRFHFSHSRDTVPVYVGRLPGNSVIQNIRVGVQTAFTGAKIKFGTTDACDDMGEADVGAVGMKACTVPEAKRFVPEDEVSIYAKLDKKVNTGDGIILIDFVPNI